MDRLALGNVRDFLNVGLGPIRSGGRAALLRAGRGCRL